MRTLVMGGTGTVGSHIVKLLLKKQIQVRVLTTSLEKATELPDGAEAFVGNLEDPASLDGLFTGVNAAFMLNGTSLTEVAQGLNAVEAARQAGIQKFVYQSIHNVRKSPEIPHFKAKILIEEAVIHSGIPYTFICPNNFYQNDFWFAEAISNYRVYPQPIGDVGLSRVDVRDVAEAAVNALTTDAFNGLSIPVVGPQALTGNETASIYTQQLGIEVHYAGNDLEAWSEAARKTLPGWIVEDWKQMYSFFQQNGLAASAEDLKATEGILGRKPRSFEEFVREHRA
ncbi:MAG: NmrA family NAD(P)-binding protein, partial [Pontibacter sp.]|nr:NmrA family NAD(P)-binding protein [Pontibacter sp.]